MSKISNTLQAGQEQHHQAQFLLFPNNQDKIPNTPASSTEIVRQNIQMILEDPNQMLLEGIESEEKILNDILQNIEALANNLHKDHKRQAKDFYTGEPAPYTWHLSAVANETNQWRCTSTQRD